MSSEHFHGVVVVGAGPVGMCAATALAQLGVPVLVLEAGHQLSTESRASTFHPPSLELLDSIGAYEPLAASGLKVPTFQYRSRTEGLIAEFDLSILASLTRYPFRIQREQSQLTPILVQLLMGTGTGEVRFGHRAVAAGQDEEHAWLEVDNGGELQRITAPFVLGADGAGSRVRQSLHVEFEGMSYDDRFLVISTDFALEKAIPGIAYVNYVADPDEWVVLLRTPNEWRVLSPVPRAFNGIPATAEIRARLEKIAPGAGTAEIVGASIYPVHQRVARTFRSGRLLLLGDAAHVNSPIGGMGMNSGISDAFMLAGALHQVFRGASTAVLDEYALTRRRFALDYVQVATRRNTENLGLKDPATAARRRQDLIAISKDPERCLQYLAASCLMSARLPASAQSANIRAFEKGR